MVVSPPRYITLIVIFVPGLASAQRVTSLIPMLSSSTKNFNSHNHTVSTITFFF